MFNILVLTFYNATVRTGCCPHKRAELTAWFSLAWSEKACTCICTLMSCTSASDGDGTLNLLDCLDHDDRPCCLHSSKQWQAKARTFRGRVVRRICRNKRQNVIGIGYYRLNGIVLNNSNKMRCTIIHHAPATLVIYIVVRSGKLRPGHSRGE